MKSPLALSQGYLVRIFTDGSCCINAGWAFVAVNHKDVIIAEHSGSIPYEKLEGHNSTAAELFAVGQAITWAKKNQLAHIRIHYDATVITSQLCKKNHKSEIFKRYDAFVKRHQQIMSITFRKVKAHSDNPFNSRADYLAYAAAKTFSIS